MSPPPVLTRPRRPGNPYRVLASLLYARFAWVERAPDGTLTAQTTKFAKALGLRTQRLHTALCELKELGYLDRLIWHHGWFLAQPACPRGLVRLVGPSEPPAAPRPAYLDGPEVLDVAADDVGGRDV